MRVSFPVRQMLRLLSQAISRNVERLSYAERLHTKKMASSLALESKLSSDTFEKINSITSDRQHVSKLPADNLLSLLLFISWTNSWL